MVKLLTKVLSTMMVVASFQTAFAQNVSSPERHEVLVARWLDNESLDLLKITNFNSSAYRGRIIDYVDVEIADLGLLNRGTLQLLSDGFLQDQLANPKKKNTLVPRSSLHIGFNLNQLDLNVLGKVFVVKVAVGIKAGNYNPPYPPGPGPGHNQIRLRAGIYKTLYHGERLELMGPLGINRYPGYRLESLVITGRSAGNMTSSMIAYAQGFPEGQVAFTNYNQSKVIYPRPNYYVGNSLRSLELVNQGTTTVATVEAILVK
jgi:hypothetical protein